MDMTYSKSMKTLDYIDDSEGVEHIDDIVPTPGINRRSNYYKKLGITRRSSLSSSRLGSVFGISCMNKNQEQSLCFDQSCSNIRLTNLNPNFQKSRKFEAVTPRMRLRRFSSEGAISLDFLKKVKSNQEEKATPEMIKNLETADSTPEKSLAESDQDVYDSFCMPEVDNYQLEYRKNILEKANSDSDTMRKKYLNKLTQSRVWLLPREKPKTHQSLIIFDWDDTLL